MFKLHLTEQGLVMSLIEAQECISCGMNFYTTDESHVDELCPGCNAELLAISKEEKPLNDENNEQEFEI
jgi:predicted RNA-binding Zn-ribbon protein involved in translation (DUF1610 family)